MSYDIVGRPPSAPNMQNWKPFEHIDHACELLARAEQQTAGPADIALAQAHIALANAKMLGRQRA